MTFKLLANGREVAASQPVVFNIGAHGDFQASWSAPIPVGGQTQLVVTVVASGDVNPANNQVSVPLAAAPAIVGPPHRR